MRKNFFFKVCMYLVVCVLFVSVIILILLALLKQDYIRLVHNLTFLVAFLIGASTVTSLPHHRKGRSTVALREGVYSNEAPASELTELQGALSAIRSDLTCPLTMAPEHFRLQTDRALCPWKWEVDTDTDRLPEVVSHAVCKCEDCELDHLGSYPDAPELSASGCREVYKTAFALRRETPGDHTSPFVPTQMWVSVACVCQLL